MGAEALMKTTMREVSSVWGMSPMEVAERLSTPEGKATMGQEAARQGVGRASAPAGSWWQKDLRRRWVMREQLGRVAASRQARNSAMDVLDCVAALASIRLLRWRGTRETLAHLTDYPPRTLDNALADLDAADALTRRPVAGGLELYLNPELYHHGPTTRRAPALAAYRTLRGSLKG